jgi:hypothetical protein
MHRALTWRPSDRVGRLCHACHHYGDRQSVSCGHCRASPAASIFDVSQDCMKFLFRLGQFDCGPRICV